MVLSTGSFCTCIPGNLSSVSPSFIKQSAYYRCFPSCVCHVRVIIYDEVLIIWSVELWMAEYRKDEKTLFILILRSPFQHPFMRFFPLLYSTFFHVFVNGNLLSIKILQIGYHALVFRITIAVQWRKLRGRPLSSWIEQASRLGRKTPNETDVGHSRWGTYRRQGGWLWWSPRKTLHMS